MNRTKTTAAFAVLGAGALALSACSGQGGSGNGGGAAEEPELDIVAYEQVDGADVSQGGALRLPVTSTPTAEGSWNPNHAQAQNVDVQDILEPTLGQLGMVQEDGEVVPNPDYATAVELVSESPQTVSIVLNEDAVWEDGTPITANDWAATFNVAGDVEAGYEVVPSAVFQVIDDISVVSDTELTVTFSEAFADWGTLMLVAVVPEAIAEDLDDFNTGYADQPIPSAGPYVFDTVDNNAQIYTLAPNPNWWGENEPKLDSVSFQVIAQEAVPQAFANDEVDFVEIMTPDALATAEGKQGVEIQRSGGLTWAHLTFNGKVAPFDDVNVRKAVASAIDRELIAQVANEPLGAPSATLGDWIFMPGQDGYVDAFGETYQRDADAVAEHLEASGYELNGDWWELDGERLSFDIIVPAGTESNINRALGVQDSLAEFGIEVNLDESPAEQYFTNMTDGAYQAATFGWQGTPFPISSSGPVYYPEQEFGDQAGQNYTFITDERLAPLFDQANAELDPDARIDIANEISNVLADYLPSIPIHPYAEVGAADEGLVNYGMATFKSTDWSIVGYVE